MLFRSQDLDEIAGKMKLLNKNMDGLLELSKVATNIPELAVKVKAIEAERQEWRGLASQLKTEIKGIEGFLAIDAQNLIRGLAQGNTYASRYQLRVAIRQNIERIELFRQAPPEFVPPAPVDNPWPGIMQRMRERRAVKLVFANGAVRWITDMGSLSSQLDGKMPKRPAIVKNAKGVGVIIPMERLEKVGADVHEYLKTKRKAKNEQAV